MEIYEKVITIYPDLKMEDFFPQSGSILLRNDMDGKGYYIAKWEHPVYTKPTQEQLDALENVEYQPIFTEANSNQYVQKHLDSVAQSKGYDNTDSILTYLTDPNPQWKAEAQTFVDWRSAVWTKVFDILTQMKSGTLVNPTVNSVVAQLPVIQWP